MAAGTLDKTFGTDGGWSLGNFYSGKGSAGIFQAIDSNGKIVVTGYTIDNDDVQRLLIARYTSNGILDTSFGSNGWTATNFYSGKASVGNSLVIDSSGKIVVTGYTNDNDDVQRLLVARYTSSGTLDTSFGTSGWTATNFYSGKASNGFSLSIDISGKIVVTGFTRDNDDVQRLLVARYTNSGTLDTSFGSSGNGYTIGNFYSGKASFGVFLAIDSNGKIVVTGYTIDNDDINRLLLAKYTISGTLDTSFGSSGNGWTATTFYSGKGSGGGRLAIDSSGKIVVTGYTVDNDGVDRLLVAKYTSNGELDNSFGTSSLGWTATNFYNGTLSFGQSLAIDSNGKIVVSGITFDNDGLLFRQLVARYTSSGTLDTGFGTSGLGWTATKFYSGKASREASLAIDSNGNIIVTGYIQDIVNNNTQLLIAKYLGSSTTTTTTTEPICVPAGTPILTDQGLVAIESIQPAKHTINKARIVAITKTITPEKVLVVFEANSMGINNPSKRTTMTPGHEVLYKGKLVQAKNFVGRIEGVHNVPYTGEVLYNVLMEKHGLMRVNNMVLETLHPQNKVAKEILGKL